MAESFGFAPALYPPSEIIILAAAKGLTRRSGYDYDSELVQGVPLLLLLHGTPATASGRGDRRAATVSSWYRS